MAFVFVDMYRGCSRGFVEEWGVCVELYYGTLSHGHALGCMVWQSTPQSVRRAAAGSGQYWHWFDMTFVPGVGATAMLGMGEAIDHGIYLGPVNEYHPLELLDHTPILDRYFARNFDFLHGLYRAWSTTSSRHCTGNGAFYCTNLYVQPPDLRIFGESGYHWFLLRDVSNARQWYKSTHFEAMGLQFFNGMQYNTKRCACVPCFGAPYELESDEDDISPTVGDILPVGPVSNQEMPATVASEGRVYAAATVAPDSRVSTTVAGAVERGITWSQLSQITLDDDDDDE